MPTQLLAGESMVLPTIRKHWIVLFRSMVIPSLAALILVFIVDGPVWDIVTGTNVKTGRSGSVPLIEILFFLACGGVVLSMITAMMGIKLITRVILVPSLFVIIVSVLIAKGPLRPIADAIGADVRVVVTLLGLAIIGLAAWWSWFDWRAASLTVTDQRVILEQGVFIRTSKVIPLDRVQDVSTRQDLLGRFLDYGSLEIDTAGAIPNELFNHASHPEMLRDQVFVLSEQLRRGL